MNMLLNHQKRRNLGGGAYVGAGEDGSPYAGDGLIIVADGLGGRGGFPHSKINPEILYKTIFYPKFIESVLGAADDDFQNFVTNSFRELFVLQDKYFEGTANMRTSGYFASRLVTAIVLHAFRFNQSYRRDVIFENLRKRDEEGRKTYADTVAKGLASLIAEKLAVFADKMGLELESKTKGSYLLPTTLAVALTDESENGVDVLYLWAGDSRGYAWDGDGLAQITDDHETDETMTNLITLTRPFRIEAKFSSFKKPVMLFNATDGCYKCPCFASPFDLECVFLQAILSSRDFNETKEKLDAQFGEMGTHDDSNTMALLTFGFESFDAVKAAAAKRQDDLQKQIIERLPDILEHDYEEERDALDEQIGGGVMVVKDDLFALDFVKDFAKECMVKDGYAPYTRELGELNRKYEELGLASENQYKNILNWVGYYWLRGPVLKKYSAACKDLDRNDSYEKFAYIAHDCNEARTQYINKYSALLGELTAKFSSVMEMRDSILNIDMLGNREFAGKLSVRLEEVRELLDSVHREIVKGKAEKWFPDYFDKRKLMEDLISYYDRRDGGAIENFAKGVFDGEIDLSGINMSPECRARVDGYLAVLHGIAEQRGEIIAVNESGELKEKHLPAYMNEHARDIVLAILRERRDMVPESIKSRVADNVGELEAKREAVESCLELRNQLYGLYNKSYLRYFSESEL